MRKNALRKDFFAEIFHTFPRFISIFLIVLLGVAFFSGIRAGDPDLRYSNDSYFDSRHLHDIRVIGTLGLTDDDVSALEQVDGVQAVYPGWSIDLLSEKDGEQQVLHIHSASNDHNRADVSEGRFPQSTDECLMDADFAQKFDYRIGDTITLADQDANPSDQLKTDRFVVVGLGSSPEYASLSRGASTIGHGEADGFLLVPPAAFCMDAYTRIDLAVSGAAEETAFTSAYENKVQPVLDKVAALADERCTIRYEQVTGDAQAKLAEAQGEWDSRQAEANRELAAAQKKLEDAQTELEDGQTAYEAGKAKLQSGRAELDKQAAAIAEGEAALRQAQQQLEDGQTVYLAGIDQAQQGEARLQQAQTELDAKAADWQRAQQDYVSGQAQLKHLQQQLAQTQADIAQLQQAGLSVPESLLQAEQQLTGGVDALTAALTEAAQQLQQGQAALEQGRAALNDQQAQLENARARLTQTKAQLDAAQAALNAQRTQIETGKSALAQGRRQLETSQRQLEQAAQQLETGRRQLESGQTAFAQKKQEADQKLADGQREIVDAKAEIDDIQRPTWIVNDRSALPGYTECGDNADRIRAIGEVFPVIFFLVAALISLTTMTRMVEEERIQIGTLKALGYGRWPIAKKYLYYALLATVGGSVAGILIGQKVIPFVIVSAYKIMYPHVPDVVIPYNWGYGLLATGAAVVCTAAAALFSCWNELKSNPAALMRPAPPKQGKRILLERLRPLWKRLSFSQKATFRNLARYKRRLFMTVIGIGGCMALIVVGFGLKDSISDVAALQFNEIQHYNGMLLLEDGITDAQTQELRQSLLANADVEACSPMLMADVNIKGAGRETECQLVAPAQPDGLNGMVSLHSRSSGESYALDDSGVILTEKFAKQIGVKAGESILIDRDGKTVSATVRQIAENYLYHYCYISPRLYTQLFGAPPQANTIVFKTLPGADSRAVGQQLLRLPGALSVSYLDSVQQQLDDMLGSLNVVMVVLIVSAGLLAFVVLYNLNNININERRRELASIKVLGFTDIEVAGYVYRENIYLTLLGMLLGVLLGGLLHQFVVATVEIDSCMFGRAVYLHSYLLGALLTAAFSVLVNWAMYFKLKKIDMVESLKSVE